jgi:hypothetical protein
VSAPTASGKAAHNVIGLARFDADGHQRLYPAETAGLRQPHAISGNGTPLSSSRFSRSCTVVRDTPSWRASSDTGMRALVCSNAMSSSSFGVSVSIIFEPSISVYMTYLFISPSFARLFSGTQLQHIVSRPPLAGSTTMTIAPMPIDSPCS